MKMNIIQTAFLSGETSPRLLARVDEKLYQYAVKTLHNGIPFYHGGVNRRPGLFWIDEVRNSAKKVKMVPFIYSRTQSYVAVFNDGKIQFIKNGSFIESAPDTRYEITHTYTEDELNEIRFAQFGNIVYFTHPNHPPQKLVRSTDTSWALTDITFIHRALTGEWFENSYVRFKIIAGSTAFLAGDTWTFTVASGVAGTPSKTGTGNGLMVAAGVSGAPDETWTVTCVYADNLRQEWSVTGSVSGSAVHTFRTGNYPTAIAFYQQRLWLAGTPLEPQTVWMSQLGDFTNLTTGTADYDGAVIQLASSSNDLILHLVASSSNLLVMSYANEFVITSTSGVYSPSTISAKPQTSHGCNLVSPLRIGHDVIFCQRDGRRVRSVVFDLEKSANTARDLTIISEHISGDGIIDMTFQQDPDFVVWSVREDGALLSLTYLDEKETVAWARHTTDGDVLGVCSIPENNTDRTYVVVERTINSVKKRYIESIDYLYQSNTDSSIFGFSGTAKTNWDGLDHLEGKTVDIVADGSVVAQKVVTSGEINLDVPAESIEVGLPYTTTVELLHPNVEMTGGSSQGRQTSVHKVILRLQDTVGARVNDVDIPWLRVGDPMDTPPEPFTGDKSVAATGWRSPINIKIEQVLPKPFTLLGVILHLTIND